jgi:hypothetical protein
MWKRSYFLQHAKAIIATLAAICLFSGWAIAETILHSGAFYPDKAELESVKADLARIDHDSADGQYENASSILGKDIKARDVYRLYLKKADEISEDLLHIRSRLSAEPRTISLQQLGAMVQRLSAENLRFAAGFQHGEQHFQTYQLIEKAVSNLQDAIAYWRVATQYRPLYRGSAREKADDDDVLELKIQTAVNAIDSLNTIVETRTKLSKDLEED